MHLKMLVGVPQNAGPYFKKLFLIQMFSCVPKNCFSLRIRDYIYSRKTHDINFLIQFTRNVFLD